MVDKCLPLREAIAMYVHDGMSVAIEGFTSFISFAAGHEIIRQRRRDLTLIRMTPDLIYDQMIAAGVARKMAGATRLPFYPLRSYLGSEMPLVNDQIKFIESPYGGEKVAVVPPLNPDIAILHAQRADVQGNTQLWGLLGVQKEVAFAARKVIIVAEEIVDEAVIRADPNRTIIPGLIVDAVVHVPYGAHPSYVQGYYDRDNAFYIMWDELSRDPQKVHDWLDEWVYGVADHAEYLQKLGTETLERIQPGSASAAAIEYGAYR